MYNLHLCDWQSVHPSILRCKVEREVTETWDPTSAFSENTIEAGVWDIKTKTPSIKKSSSRLVHEKTGGHWSLSDTISCVTDRSRFLPVVSISWTGDRQELRVTGTKCRLPDTMSGTGKKFISSAERYALDAYFNLEPKTWSGLRS